MTTDTKKPRQASASAGSSENEAASAFDKLGTPMLGWAHMQAMALRSILTQQHEYLEFMRRRCEHDLQLVNTIAKAREPQAIVEAMNDFYRTAAKDYVAEVGRTAETAPRAAVSVGEATVEMVKSFAEPESA